MRGQVVTRLHFHLLFLDRVVTERTESKSSDLVASIWPHVLRARASSVPFPVRTGRFIELTELYSAANAGRTSGCSVELWWT